MFNFRQIKTFTITFLSFILLFSNVNGQDEIKLYKAEFISDKSIGYSVADRAGDDNSNIDAGEKITMKISLTAVSEDFISTSAKLISTDKYVKIVDSKVDFNDIPKGKTVNGNQYISYEIDEDCPHGHSIKFTLKINDSRKRDSKGDYYNYFVYFKVLVSNVGPLIVGDKIIDDDDIGQSTGNDNGLIEKSDGRIEVPLTISNKGKPTVTTVTATLSSKQKYVEIFDNSLKYKQLKGGSDTYTPADYVFKLNTSAPKSVSKLNMELELIGYYKKYRYDWSDSFELGSNSYGSLEIRTNLDNAMIYLKGNFYYGKLNYLKDLQTDEKYRISITCEGYEPEDISVEILRNTLSKVNIVLAEKPENLVPFKTLDDYDYPACREATYPYIDYLTPSDYYIKPVLKRESKYKTFKAPFFLAGSLAGILVGAVVPVEDDRAGAILGGWLAGMTLGIGIDALAGNLKNDHRKYYKKNIEYNKKVDKEAQELAQYNAETYNNNQKRIADAQYKKAKEDADKYNASIKEEQERIVYLMETENEKIKIENEPIVKKNELKAKERKVEYWIGDKLIVDETGLNLNSIKKEEKKYNDDFYEFDF